MIPLITKDSCTSPPSSPSTSLGIISQEHTLKNNVELSTPPLNTAKKMATSVREERDRMAHLARRISGKRLFNSPERENSKRLKTNSHQFSCDTIQNYWDFTSLNVRLFLSFSKMNGGLVQQAPASPECCGQCTRAITPKASINGGTGTKTRRRLPLKNGHPETK